MKCQCSVSIGWQWSAYSQGHSRWFINTCYSATPNQRLTDWLSPAQHTPSKYHSNHIEQDKIEIEIEMLIKVQILQHVEQTEATFIRRIHTTLRLNDKELKSYWEVGKQRANSVTCHTINFLRMVERLRIFGQEARKFIFQSFGQKFLSVVKLQQKPLWWSLVII